ncbi:MAG: hypothetical protein ABFC84_03060 [Veillonellales bacterium]
MCILHFANEGNTLQAEYAALEKRRESLGPQEYITVTLDFDSVQFHVAAYSPALQVEGYKRSRDESDSLIEFYKSNSRFFQYLNDDPNTPIYASTISSCIKRGAVLANEGRPLDENNNDDRTLFLLAIFLVSDAAKNEICQKCVRAGCKIDGYHFTQARADYVRISNDWNKISKAIYHQEHRFIKIDDANAALNNANMPDGNIKQDIQFIVKRSTEIKDYCDI